MFKYLIKVSRPRFWHYTVGPFLIGSLIAFHGNAVPMFLSKDFWIWTLYFLLPANFLIYGVNDVGDQDTDMLNPKKNSYETKFENSKFLVFLVLFFLCTIPFLFLTNSWAEKFWLFVFWFFSIFYSIEPIRAKAKAFLDSAFNFLYVVPGIFAYIYFSGSSDFFNINWLIVLAATFWCMAMHTFSAIPDIKADSDSNLNTTAVFLGNKGASIYCLWLFIAATALGILTLSWAILILGIPYFIAMIINYKIDNLQFSFKLYKYFPTYNLLVGFLLFWLIVWEFRIDLVV